MAAGKADGAEGYNRTPAKGGGARECYHVWKIVEHARDGRNAMVRMNVCYPTRSAANKALNRAEDPFGLNLRPDGKPDALVLRCRWGCGCRQSRRRNPCPALADRPDGEGETEGYNRTPAKGGGDERG